jgi:hypothetical protein
MYCPRCSHEQGLEEMRFCSRCGFPLAGVAILLDNSGVIPPPTSDPTQLIKRRSCMIKESLFLTLLAWAIGLALTLMWDVGVPLESAAKVGSFVFFLLGLVGLLRFLYAFLFVTVTAKSSSQSTLPSASYSRLIPEHPSRVALPPNRTIPVTDYSPRSNTREIVSQPSVTENTTRLLEDPGN